MGHNHTPDSKRVPGRLIFLVEEWSGDVAHSVPDE
jgi:hypothetical protein